MSGNTEGVGWQNCQILPGLSAGLVHKSDFSSATLQHLCVGLDQVFACPALRTERDVDYQTG